MNVLLSCAGRRNYLLQYFERAVGPSGVVLVADACADVACAIEAGERYIPMPPVQNPDYFSRLLDVCVAQSVRLLVSLNDFELPGLAREAETFRRAGVIPVVSSPDVVDLCFDKWKLYQYLTAREIPTPHTILASSPVRASIEQGQLRLPVIVKPRWGTGSKYVVVVRELADLDSTMSYVGAGCRFEMLNHPDVADPRDGVIVQQMIEGREYGLDVVNDLSGEFRAVFVKQKLAMRAGETDRAVTVSEPSLEALGKRVGRLLKHIGVLDADTFLSPAGPVVLELNPRFGGGYPFSHAAGCDVPAALVAWAAGLSEPQHSLAVLPNVVSAKCDHLVSRHA